MEIWKGSVEVPYVKGTYRILEDLCISTAVLTAGPSSSVTNHLNTYLKNSTLSFLSYLPPSCVPFFLAAGPSLEVTTSSPTTCDFFRNLFLSALPKPSHGDGKWGGADDHNETEEQSRIALLLKVRSELPPDSDSDDVISSVPSDWGISELLIYGSITHPLSISVGAISSISTPPHSSPEPPIPAPLPVVSVHALPLSSRHGFSSCIPKKPEPNQDARFIAPNPEDILNPVISRSTKKRRAEVLDRAVDKKTKKFKRPEQAPLPSQLRPPPLTLIGSRSVLGGRNANVGSGPGSTSMLSSSHDNDFVIREDSLEPLSVQKRRASGGNVANETGSKQAHRRTVSDSKPTERPKSSSGSLIPRPRSATLKPEKRTTRDQSAIDTKERPRSEVENKNRDLLNKLVLEEMRRRGLKDYRKDINSNSNNTLRRSTASPPSSNSSTEKEDPAIATELAVVDEKHMLKRREEEREEYKAIFHHTAKAAVFALRHDGFSELAMNPDKMRRCVEKLLGVFLDDGKENVVDVARQSIEG